MKYLKTYNKIFESSSNESTKLDLKDILLELQDMGYRIIHEDDVLAASTGLPGNVKAIAVMNTIHNSVRLPWSELKDYALRIKDYLGDKYLNFMWRGGYEISTADKPFKKVELNEMTEIKDDIWSFVIKYKE